jgi:HAMP domain-containing protein
VDIRTKLVFALVAVSLVSMLALGTFSYLEARDLLQDNAVRQLQALAESKKQDLEKVIVGWRDRVALITSQRELAANLEATRFGEVPEAVDAATRILRDALAAVPSLRGISVYTPEGRPVAAAGHDPDPTARVAPATFWMADSPLVYDNVARDPEGGLVVTFVAPIRLGDRLVGATKVVLSARELLDITNDYTGLGETGETLMARRTEDGDALILNPLRHDPDAMLTRVIPAEQTKDPTVSAVKGLGTLWRRGAIDYRGADILAASRHLQQFDWGLVVKVDRAEELRPVLELRATMIRLGLAISAFAIVAGTVLGIFFARPIRELADVARRIGDGELDLRADATSEDEIGFLAETFNRMAAALVEANRDLERKMRSGGS